MAERSLAGWLARKLGCGNPSISREEGRDAMYAIDLHCLCCGADVPLTHRGSCPVCTRAGEESALNETLGVRYDVAALKSMLDRDELVRRPAGLWRYHELLPVADPAFRI